MQLPVRCLIYELPAQSLVVWLRKCPDQQNQFAGAGARAIDCGPRQDRIESRCQLFWEIVANTRTKSTAWPAGSRWVPLASGNQTDASGQSAKTLERSVLNIAIARPRGVGSADCSCHLFLEQPPSLVVRSPFSLFFLFISFWLPRAVSSHQRAPHAHTSPPGIASFPPVCT